MLVITMPFSLFSVIKLFCTIKPGAAALLRPELPLNVSQLRSIITLLGLVVLPQLPQTNRPICGAFLIVKPEIRTFEESTMIPFGEPLGLVCFSMSIIVLSAPDPISCTPGAKLSIGKDSLVLLGE